MNNTDLSTMYTILIVLSACLVGYGCKGYCCNYEEERYDNLQDEIVQMNTRNIEMHERVQRRMNGFIRMLSELTNHPEIQAAPLPSAPQDPQVAEAVAEIV